MAQKLCRKCNQTKNLDCFGDRSDKPHLKKSHCYECISNKENVRYYEQREATLIKRKEYRKNNAEEINRKNRELYKKNKYHLKKYGIGVEEYNEMFSEQNGCCKICNTHQAKLDRALAVDHCHATGRVRGLLCFRCNVVLGKLEDSIELLDKAKEYLIGGGLSHRN